MNSRNDFTRRLAGFRWWGCVLLSMFAVVQTARGTVEPASRPEPARPDNTLGLIGHFRLQYDIRYRTTAPDIPVRASQRSRINGSMEANSMT